MITTPLEKRELDLSGVTSCGCINICLLCHLTLFTLTVDFPVIYVMGYRLREHCRNLVRTRWDYCGEISVDWRIDAVQGPLEKINYI